MTGKVSVCVTCRGGAELAEALKAQGDPRLMPNLVDCMNVCVQPACLSVRAEGKAAYLFGDVSEAHTGDLSAFMDLYDNSPDGVIADARPAGELRFCVIGIIPA